MTSFKRQLDRSKSKKEYKLFVKNNPKYKALPYGRYHKLSKAGLLDPDKEKIASELKMASAVDSEFSDDLIQIPDESSDDIISNK